MHCHFHSLCDKEAIKMSSTSEVLKRVNFRGGQAAFKGETRAQIILRHYLRRLCVSNYGLNPFVEWKARVQITPRAFTMTLIAIWTRKFSETSLNEHSDNDHNSKISVEIEGIFFIFQII